MLTRHFTDSGRAADARFSVRGSRGLQKSLVGELMGHLLCVKQMFQCDMNAASASTFPAPRQSAPDRMHAFTFERTITLAASTRCGQPEGFSIR